VAADRIASEVHNGPAQMAPMKGLPHVRQRSILRLRHLMTHLQMFVKALRYRLLAAQLAPQEARHGQVVRQNLLAASARPLLALYFVIVVFIVLVIVLLYVVVKGAVVVFAVVEDNVRIGRHTAAVVSDFVVVVVAVLVVINGDHTVRIRTIVIVTVLFLLGCKIERKVSSSYFRSDFSE